MTREARPREGAGRPATPLPWVTFQREKRGDWAITEDGHPVNLGHNPAWVAITPQGIPGADAANAAYIVAACNAHPDFVRMAEYAANMPDADNMPEWAQEMRSIARSLLTSLAEVGEAQP